MNNEIIKNWNATVKREDTVIILGDVGSGTFEEMKSIIHSLHGDLTLLTKNKEQFSDSEWRKIGFHFVWRVPLFHDFEDYSIYYAISPIRVISVYEERYKVVLVDHNNPIDGMTNGVLLSVDAKKWNYCPLDIEQVASIHENLKQFESMSNEEHRSDIKEE